MGLDFSKLTGTSTVDSVINPRELFGVLPNKPTEYKYLRDVQSEVLNQWFARREQKDVRIKMNTGGGKTIVGLLILKSCLNEHKGPAVYIAPTPYLATRVMEEAKTIGIPVDDDPRSIAVLRGRAILVTHIHVLINGRSKFGVGDRAEIPIGSLVFDDAHACLATAEQKFTLEIPAAHPAYTELFALLRSDLESQSPSRLQDVELHTPHRQMLVPFYAWQQKIEGVRKILSAHKDSKEIEWAWPLIREHLPLCRCVVGEGKMEVSPKCLPISVIPSFEQAHRRVFMSATFADDSVLVTQFDANPDQVRGAIVPQNASDIGDRMILAPQELSPDITDEEIKQAVARRAAKYNVVVIVPSNARAAFWKPVAQLALTAENLEEGVKRLKAGHVGLAVLINKYDGIDLPYEACRVLVIDGIPDARRAIDEVEQMILYGSDLEMSKSIQQIEQGMGRGVRAIDDHCVVLLMGRSLLGHLFSRGAISKLTSATREQFKLSEQIGDQLRTKPMKDIDAALDYSLKRDPAWVNPAKGVLVNVKYEATGSEGKLASRRRAAFNAASLGQHATACAELQQAVNETTDRTVKGWLMAELAEYTCFVNPVEAHQILKSGLQLNHNIVRPQGGTDYIRVGAATADQATLCLETFREFTPPTALLLAVNALVEELQFRSEGTSRFERAFADVARFVGYKGQRPEAEFGVGPDVLWSLGDLKYLVIECKSGVTTTTVNKHDANQLAGSMNWFASTYDHSCTATPVLVHRATQFEHAATPPLGTRIMTPDLLERFCEAVSGLALSASRLTRYGSVTEIAGLLRHYGLTQDLLLNRYTVPPR